jgi:hypothetical protein
VSDLFEQPDRAATPLTPEEMRDLIPAHIAAQFGVGLFSM